jgi:hypothetical protein
MDSRIMVSLRQIEVEIANGKTAPASLQGSMAGEC